MNKTKESILADLEKLFISGADSTNEKWFPPAIIEFVSKSLEEYADWKIKELQKEYNKLDKLCGKYSNVIAMVYDGERVDIAEKRVGLIK